MNESAHVISEKNYLITNVSIVAICRIAGVATGIVADAMILNKFGVGKETDALFAAIAVPLVFTRILEIQAPNVLVPVFSSDAARYDREKFSYYTGNFIVITALILFIFSLAGIAASGFLMSIQVPGFQDSARYLAIGLSKILFWLIFIQGLDTIIKCLLLSQHHFVIASSSKILVNLALVASIIMLQSQFSIYAVAIGYIVGSIVSLCMVSSAVFIAGIRIKLVCKLNDKQFHHTMKLFALPLSGHVFGESKDLFENYIVSFLGSGNSSIRLFIVTICTGIVFYYGTLPFNNFTNTDMISRLISFCIPSALGFSAFIVASIFFKLGDWNFFTKLFKIHIVRPSSIGNNSPLVTTKDLHYDNF